MFLVPWLKVLTDLKVDNLNYEKFQNKVWSLKNIKPGLNGVTMWSSFFYSKAAAEMHPLRPRISIHDCLERGDSVERRNLSVSSHSHVHVYDMFTKQGHECRQNTKGEKQYVILNF